MNIHDALLIRWLSSQPAAAKKVSASSKLSEGGKDSETEARLDLLTSSDSGTPRRCVGGGCRGPEMGGFTAAA